MTISISGERIRKSVTPDLTPTPEPATPVTLALGLSLVAGCIVVRRRRAIPSTFA